jgi:hypothetical protein
VHGLRLHLCGELRVGGDQCAGVLEGVGPADFHYDALKLTLVLEELADLFLAVARSLIQPADGVKPPPTPITGTTIVCPSVIFGMNPSGTFYLPPRNGLLVAFFVMSNNFFFRDLSPPCYYLLVAVHYSCPS